MSSRTPANLANAMGQARVSILRLTEDEQRASTPTERDSIKARLDAAKQQLSELIDEAKQATGQPPLPEGIVAIPIVQVQERRIALHQRAEQLQLAKAQVKEARVATAAQRAAQRKMIKAIDAKMTEIVKRDKMLAQGVDVDAPPELSPKQIRVPRVGLAIPSMYAVPPNGMLQDLVAKVAALRPRRTKETAGAYNARLRGYAARALARYLNNRAAGKEELPAFTEAVSDTLSEDTQALETEAASGGVATDPASEQVSEILDEAAPLFEEVSKQAPPPGVDELVLESEGLEGQLIAGAVEPSARPAVPFYKQPIVWIAGAIGLAIVLRGVK